MWLGILLAWFFGIILHIFPIAGATASRCYQISPGSSLGASAALVLTICLSFFGDVRSWAIGMRNMIIYELERIIRTTWKHWERRAAWLENMPSEMHPSPNHGSGSATGCHRCGCIGYRSCVSYPGIGYLLLPRYRIKITSSSRDVSFSLLLAY